MRKSLLTRNGTSMQQRLPWRSGLRRQDEKPEAVGSNRVVDYFFFICYFIHFFSVKYLFFLYYYFIIIIIIIFLFFCFFLIFRARRPEIFFR